MTNNWTDIGNASMVFVMGANPSENHPACMAHINKARANGASLVVVDPRKTRTATQADRFIRIRPGTDIAFINGVIKGIIDDMEARPSDGSDAVRDAFYAFLNRTDGGLFYTDGDGTSKSQLTDGLSGRPSPIAGSSKYTDARFILKADGSDYDREKISALTGVAVVGGETADITIDKFPKKAATVFADANTVYNRLKGHVAPYDAATVADICGCTEADLAFVVAQFIANSRCSSPGGFGTNAQDPRVAGYKATTMLYAMGITQHTYGAQNVKSFAVLQTLMGNMGRAGGGINALRGIHNVQGSTDMGLLYGNIPAYSGNPTLMTTGGVTVSNDANAFGKYMDALWGNPLSGTGTRTTMNGSYDDAYVTGAMALQQRGFYNMTLNFFSDPAWAHTRSQVDGVYDLWPKTNGDDHVTMFRKMGLGSITAAVVWGQNPAVTEPNQGAVRAGLENLNLLVCVDLFENETAACSRKAAGETYLIPTCSHVEEAGSVTNSGRVLQWRERARVPAGNSKADLELLLRFAKALDDANAFSHITDTWTAQSRTFTDAYTTLYGKYGWTPGDATAFEAVTFSDSYTQSWLGTSTTPTAAGATLTGSEAFAEKIYREMAAPVGSTAALGTSAGGTIWIYTGAFNTDLSSNKSPSATQNWLVYNRAKSRDNVEVLDGSGKGTLTYGAWGYSWLVNRRVLYNNGEIPGDVTDYFMGPDSAARLFVSTSTSVLNYSRWYRTIHRMSDKPDVALAGPTAAHVLAGRFPGHTEPYETLRSDLIGTWGRNTKGGAKWDLVKSDTAVYAPDDVAGSRTDVVPADIVAAAVTVPAIAEPLVLTSIRCVEHFQGGPITRNNAWNVEAEPEPWVEINSIDAAARGINSGDWVNVYTVRGDSIDSQEALTVGASFAQGFRARVGVGLQSNQRTGQGVVAIPWHWGDKGLSTGSRANDLCIDAGDANTTIPEYKACVCWITKA